MNVKEKLMLDIKGLEKHGPINIVILGDSVSHGALLDEIDYESVYYNRLRKKLNAVRDYVPVNMINTSIGGTMADCGLRRMDSQVLIHNPDLVIVCFGLNDINGSLEAYEASLRGIFGKCNDAGVETIFMTPNMLNTSWREDAPDRWKDYARRTVEMQLGGKMDSYMDKAREVAKDCGITVCDCYAEWKKLSETQDITDLLVNRINHPTREMHELFANKLFETIMGDEIVPISTESTMYQG